MRKSSEEIVINHLKTIRRNMKISQETLARKANVTLWTYRRIENWQAEPSSLHLFRIARAIKSRPDQVFLIIPKDQLEAHRKKAKIKIYKY